MLIVANHQSIMQWSDKGASHMGEPQPPNSNVTEQANSDIDPPNLIVREATPENLEFPFHTLATFITPVEQFFVRNHFAVRGFGDPQIAIKKKVAQSARDKLCVARFYVGELCFGAIQHGLLLCKSNQFDVALQQAGSVPDW